MNKKAYQKPVMQVVKINGSHQLLNNSINKVGGNAGFNSEVSGGSGTARSRQFNVWGDDDDEDLDF